MWHKAKSVFLVCFILSCFLVLAIRSDFLRVFLSFDSGDLSIVQNILCPDEADATLDGKVVVSDGIRKKAADFMDEAGFYHVWVPERWIHMPEGMSIGLYVYSRGINKDTIILSSPFLVIRGDNVYPDRLQIELYFDDGDQEIVHLPVEIPVRQWVNIAIGVGGGVVSVFLNGKLVYQDMCWNDKLRRDKDPVRDEILIASDGSGKNTFDGKIDEFSLFSHKLTEYEAAALV